ncbi:MAG: YgaP family membrane protein [Acidimicrobiales bacterium]
MKKTVGSTDKVARSILAIAALIVAGFAGFSSVWGIVLVIVAAVLVVTAASGYCPFYSATGLNSLGEHGHRHDASAH